MKKAFSFLLLFGSLWAGSIASAEELKITLKDVAERVSSENYHVYANALKVYQAKESVQAARMNLLPKLNLWRVVGAAADVFMGLTSGAANMGGAITIVEDLAPFLIPANWFNLQRAKEFYLAESEGYRALWANELMTAKSIFFHLSMDQALLRHILQSERELDELYKIVKPREQLAGLPQSVSRDIEIRKLALSEDIRSLKTLLAEETSLLSYMLGLPTNTQIVLEEFRLPEPETMDRLSYEDFAFRVTDVSPELRQYDHLIESVEWFKKELQFSIFGISSITRGVGGGVFDSIPIQDGLGFGTQASLRVSAAQKELLKVQKKGISETLLRNLKLLVNTYNLDLDNYPISKRRIELTATAKEQLYEKLRLGQDINILQLVEASKNQIEAQTSSFTLRFRIAANVDKLRRLLFQDDYDKMPELLQSIRSRP